MTILCVWGLLSVATTLVLIPCFRAQASYNAGLERADRSSDWLAAAQPALAPRTH
jgi:hypothetical protein